MSGSAASAWWKRVALGVAILAGVALIGRWLGSHAIGFAEWVADLGALGPLAFILAYSLATPAFVPGSILTLASGALFGIVAGTAWAFAGATIGASLAFLAGRYVFRDAIERRLAEDPRFEAVDAAISRQGRRIVFLLRLSPVFPFNLLNYALGTTGVRFGDFLVASVGMLPGTLLYVYFGRLIGDVGRLAAGTGQIERGPGHHALLVLGLVATVAVTVVVTRAARSALRDTADGSIAPEAGPTPQADETSADPASGSELALPTS